MMKNLTILFLAALLSTGCSKDDTNSENPQETTGLKSLTVNIALPNNSSISSNELFVSSLFTDSESVVDNTAAIESFDDDTMELTFATNQQDNIVMLSYFNPLNADVVEMNAETTATSLVMLHPWSFDLTAQAKTEAMEFIKNLPEFESFKSEVENSIASGVDQPLNIQGVVDKVIEIQQITFDRSSGYTEPLQFNVQNATASVTNVLSSATYSVGLYDENNVLFEHKPAEGLDKSHFLFQEFKNSVFQETSNNQQTATFNIPYDGTWTLKAKSGLSFDGSLENQQAAYYNTKTVAANVLGIFSTKLKKLIIKNECFLALGEHVYNGVSGSVDISGSLESYSNGSKSGFALTKDVLSFIWDRFDSVLGIIENCANENTELYGLDKIKSGVFGKILKFLNITGNLENVFNSSAMLTDWIQFDKEIEYCFSKIGNEILECEFLVNQIKVLSNNQILDFNGLPTYYFNEFDDFCNNYMQIFSINYFDKMDGANYIDIEISSAANSSTIADGVYDLLDGECNYVVVDLFHADIFTNDDDGFIQNGTLTVSENGSVFSITGEMVKITFNGTNETETSLGSVVGRFVAE
ncbi:MAG: hypothetical protein HKN48_07990 [Flavobacteriaceae bacterium]|nr:hypothetical protein [Flavobacteriaceae bacterium]